MGIEIYDLNQVGVLDLYIDGADEIDAKGNMIKGGGGALTREKNRCRRLKSVYLYGR